MFLQSIRMIFQQVKSKLTCICVLVSFQYLFLILQITFFYSNLVVFSVDKLCIAMFSYSARFKEIRINATTKWKYYRHSVVIDYEHRYPSPFNIPIRFILVLFYGLFKRACQRCFDDSSMSSKVFISAVSNLRPFGFLS